MAAITIRQLPDALHRAIKVRARANGRSAEEEVRLALAAAFLPPERVGFGDLVRDIWDGADLDGVAFDLPPEAADGPDLR